MSRLAVCCEGKVLPCKISCFFFVCLRKMTDSEKDQNAKAELKKRLTPLQYHVTQEKGTER